MESAEVEKGVPFDAPAKTVRAMLNQMDALIDALVALKDAGYVAGAGVDAAIDGLSKLKLRQ